MIDCDKEISILKKDIRSILLNINGLQSQRKKYLNQEEILNLKSLIQEGMSKIEFSNECFQKFKIICRDDEQEFRNSFGESFDLFNKFKGKILFYS